MIYKNAARRRVGWLASTSLVAGAVGAGAFGFAVISPTAALAANECGAGADVTCTPAGNPYPNGLFYLPATDQTIHLQDGVIIDSTGSLNPGILVLQAGANDSIVIDGPTGVQVTTGDPGAFGLLLATNAGDITANIDSVTTTGANAEGILASSADGVVDVTAGTVSTKGAGATGIDATTNSSAITVNSTTVTTEGANATGIVAHSDNGDVSVTSDAITTKGAGSAGVNASSNGDVGVKSGTISTTGANANGIIASSSTKTATVESTSVTTTGVGATGILVNANRLGSAVVKSGTVSATGAGALGISVFGSGDETIDSGDVTADGIGIQATTLPLFGPATSKGDIAITTTGSISSKTADAIDATSGVGSITVTTGAGTTLTAATYGVRAISSGIGDGGVDGDSDGNVTVVNNADIGSDTARVANAGIDAEVTNPASAGRVSVTLGAGADVFSTQQGILALNAGAGTASADDRGVNVTTAGTSSIDSNTGSHGVEARITNATNVNGVSVTVGGAITGVTGSGDGVRASTVGLGSVSVTTNSGSSIVGGDDAIQADIDNAASTAALSVTVNGALDPNASSGAGFGVYANNDGSGDTNVTLGSTGTISGRADSGLVANATSGALTVVNNGAIGTAGDAVDFDGIDASISDLASDATLTVSGKGSINAGDVGIYADNNGTGLTNVSGGAITAVNTGYDVTSNGVFSVTAGGNTTAGGNAILVNGASGGSVSVASGATVIGAGTPALAVIDVTSPAAVTLNNAGTIRSSNASVTAAANDTAVKVTGGPLKVNNTGRLDGHIDLTATTAPLTFVNGAGGSWHIAGTQTLTAGDDLVNNGTGGLVATQGATTLDFDGDTGAAPRDVFKNAGAVVAGETTGASTFTVTGLESFNNSGAVVFGSLNGGTSSDGQTNDRIVMTGTGGGTAFAGSSGSVLVMDANLGVTTQTNCAGAVTADCLSLPGGTFGGTNLIRVNNTATTPSGLNTGGIVLVEAGSVAPGSFTLDAASANYTTRGGAGAIDTGLFFYRLIPVGTTQVALISAPDNEAFEFTELGMAATDVWYTATGSWFDRQADLRDGPFAGGSHPGVWLKMTGDWSRRRLSQSTVSAGTTFTFDTSYKQETGAIVGGIDLMSGGGAGHAWVLGIDGGYLDSNVRFNASQTRADLKGTTVGGYGTFVSGPWYLDGTVVGTFLTLDDSIPTLSPLPGSAAPFHTKGKVRQVGGQVESGWRWGMGAFSVEPFGSLSYVRTRFDDLTVPGGSVAFNDVTSFRGSLGVRLSSTMTFEGVRIKNTLYGRAWDEWRGNDATVLTNPGAPILANDRFKGTFADVGANIAVFSTGGLTAFVNGDYKWKSNYKDYTASIGMRYQF